MKAQVKDAIAQADDAIIAIDDPAFTTNEPEKEVQRASRTRALEEADQNAHPCQGSRKELALPAKREQGTEEVEEG